MSSGKQRPLSPRQRELLGFIVGFIKGAGYSPSQWEMAAGQGCTSRHGLRQRLNRLEQRGFIHRPDGKHRAIMVLREHE